SFPKLCAALQRKFGTDAAYRAGCRYVFGLVSRDAACRIVKWEVSWRHASHLDDARCDAETVLRSLLIGGESEVRQRVVGMLGRAAAAELDVPGERRRSHT